MAAMLEKARGAVACGHCHQLGADTVCPYCRAQVHTACLTSDRCPEPHPVQLRLGTGNRLRGIDESGRYGAVGGVLGSGQRLWELAGRGDVARLPMTRGRHGVEYRGGWALGREQVCRAAVTYREERLEATGELHRIYVDSLLLVADLAPDGMREVRFVERPPQPIGENLYLARDGAWAVWASASQIDIVNLRGARPARNVDLAGQMIHDVDLHTEMELVVVAHFGRVVLFDLRGLRQGVRTIKADENVTRVSLGGGRMACVTEEGHVLVTRVQHRQAPRRWETIHQARVKVRGEIGPGEADLSHDGRLLAVRRRRKDVEVIHLDSGERQILEGHTDRVCLVRFIAGGNQLVTADNDNRVFFWPRAVEDDRIISGA